MSDPITLREYAAVAMLQSLVIARAIAKIIPLGSAYIDQGPPITDRAVELADTLIGKLEAK